MSGIFSSLPTWIFAYRNLLFLLPLLARSLNSSIDKKPWVLPVDMKEPPSITLSMPIMANAKKVVVAACGVSDKYPQGKSAGMRRAVAADDETLQTFPAVGLRGVATWIMDKAAASKLGDEYSA
jgi:6-phosphogluconolactonase/glucosamine-6-phosphate isomerase/deaminase